MQFAKIFDSIEDLPSRIKDKIPSVEGRDIFRRVFNRRFKDSKGDEGSSFAIAFTAIRNAGFKEDKEGKLVKKSEQDFLESHEFLAKNEERQIVYGWASVIEKDGKEIVDRQDDVIKIDELLTAAHEFVSDARVAKLMHQGEEIGEIVESIVFTKELQKALGIDLKQIGWFIGMHVIDDDIWKMVKQGELGAFSIGGKAIREDIE